MKKYHTLVLPALFAALLGACASPGYGPVASRPYPSSYPATYPAPVATYPAPAPAYAQGYGVVDSIRMVQANNGNPGIGVGTVVGGVVGGLLGNQVGGGAGRKAATVAGVVGGAVVGNQIDQRNAAPHNLYQVGVRLDNGTYQTFTQDSVADLQVGSRVRVDQDRVYRY